MQENGLGAYMDGADVEKVNLEINIEAVRGTVRYFIKGSWDQRMNE